MSRTLKRAFFGILVTVLVTALSGIALAEENVTVTGMVNDDYQIVADNGTIYEVAENEVSNEVLDLIGKRVQVKGTVTDSEGTLIIAIESYEVIE